MGVIMSNRSRAASRSPPPAREPASGVDHGTPNTMKLRQVLESDGQSFAGELSMDPALRNEEQQDPKSGDYYESCGGSVSGELLADGTPHLAPLSQSAISSATGKTPRRKVRPWLETILARYGLVADEQEWRRYLHVFLDDVHVLYPFLHPPSLWETFNELWEYSAFWSMASHEDHMQKRMSVALLCFCLALGRCSVSTRMDNADGVHSAGWSLHSVGIILMPDIMKMSNKCAKSLLTLQILIARVRLPRQLHPLLTRLARLCGSGGQSLSPC